MLAIKLHGSGIYNYFLIPKKEHYLMFAKTFIIYENIISTVVVYISFSPASGPEAGLQNGGCSILQS